MPTDIEEDFFSIYFDVVYHAQYFGITDMEDYLGSTAKEYLSPSTLFLRWKEAKIYNCHGLQKACEDYLSNNFAKVSLSNYWGGYELRLIHQL